MRVARSSAKGSLLNLRIGALDLRRSCVVVDIRGKSLGGCGAHGGLLASVALRDFGGAFAHFTAMCKSRVCTKARSKLCVLGRGGKAIRRFGRGLLGPDALSSSVVYAVCGSGRSNL